MSSAKGFPKGPWTPIPNRIVDLILNGQVTGELKLEIWVWMNLGRKFGRTFEPGKVVGLTAAMAQRLTGMEDRRNAARARNRVLEHLGMVSGKEDGTYIEANPNVDSDSLRDTPDDTSNRFENKGHSATSDTPSHTRRDTPGDTPETTKPNAGELPPGASRINLKKYQEEKCARNAGPLAHCDAMPCLDKPHQNPKSPHVTENYTTSKISIESSAIQYEKNVDCISSIDAFIESIPFIDFDNTQDQDPHNPASPDQFNTFKATIESCGSANAISANPKPQILLPRLPAASSAASPIKTESLAIALVNEYNDKASSAEPRIFEAVDLISEECKDILQRLVRLLEFEPNCFDHLKAIIAALPRDAFYQGQSKMGHVWTLRFLSFQTPDRIAKHGLKARSLLFEIAEREERLNSKAKNPTSHTLSRQPVYRREADQNNADQLLSAFGG